jgi:hypothetical protein
MKKIYTIFLIFMLWFAASSASFCLQAASNDAIVAMVPKALEPIIEEVFAALQAETWFECGAYKEEDLWGFVRDCIASKGYSIETTLLIDRNFEALRDGVQLLITGSIMEQLEIDAIRATEGASFGSSAAAEPALPQRIPARAPQICCVMLGY